MQKVRWFSGKPRLPSELPGSDRIDRLEISTEITLIGITDQMGALPDGFPLEEKFSGIVEFGVDDILPGRHAGLLLKDLDQIPFLISRHLRQILVGDVFVNMSVNVIRAQKERPAVKGNAVAGQVQSFHQNRKQSSQDLRTFGNSQGQGGKQTLRQISRDDGLSIKLRDQRQPGIRVKPKHMKKPFPAVGDLVGTALRENVKLPRRKGTGSQRVLINGGAGNAVIDFVIVDRIALGHPSGRAEGVAVFQNGVVQHGEPP